MAEIALAVVPIIFAAVKGFSEIKEKTNTLLHYRKEIEWLRDKVDIQACRLDGEVRRLVFDVLGTHRARLLIKDYEHPNWKNKDLEDAVRNHMGDLQPRFTRALGEVKTSLLQIQARLAVFAQPDVTAPLHQITRDKFRIAFKKKEYKDDLNNVREWMAELKEISELARKLQKSCRNQEAAERREEELAMANFSEETDLNTLKQFRASRQLSTSVQEFLRQKWECASSHSHHSGRLFVGGELPRTGVLWLLEARGRQGAGTVKNRLLFNVWAQQVGLLTPESLDRRPSEDFEGHCQKRQKVLSGAHVPRQSDHAAAQSTLASVVGLCQQLEACAIATHPQTFTHIDSRSRERFHFEPKQAAKQVLEKQKLATLSDLVTRLPEHLLLKRERVQLALALVKATLMNHSTLAWPNGCVLESIGFLSDPNMEIDILTVLNTLNLEVQVGGDESGDSVDTDMESGSVASEDELENTFGVQNRVLYRLGVALLSIGLWDKIEWKDIPAARRKAKALDAMGAKYREVVKRLIWANFDADPTNLNDERLQAEILRTVVSPLEKRAAYRRDRTKRHG
ncbi:hypothetical protein OQA88_5784 [Cercophora sp. LCS_1]